ncbi:hypothetical protein pb186bvf_005664 [Paramecium bursaria]
MNYKQIIQDILVLYFDPENTDFVLRKDFAKPHLAQKYYQCLKLGLEDLSMTCLQLIQSKLLKMDIEFKLSKLHLEYWKIFNSLPQPKDELVSFIIIVIWFIIHCSLYKSYSIEERQKFDQRFMLDEYHVLIFYLNGFFVSDDFVKIQIETYMSPHYLNYRLNSYQKKNQKKQTSQTNIFPNISVQELSTGGIQLKKDLRNKRKIKKPTEASEQPTEIFTQVSDGGKFPNTIKFNLNQLSPSVTSLLNSHQIKPCFISHKLSNSNGNDINLAKVLQNIQNHRSTSTFERPQHVNKSLKMLDRYKVPIPPADYYKKNPKVDHLFKDMLEMNLILQSNRQHMSTSPRLKDENPSARDRIILLLQEKKIQQETNREIQQKLTDDFMSTAFQSRELTNTVNTLLTSRRPSSHIQTEARQSSQKIQLNRFGYEDKRKLYYDKYSKLTEQIPTEAKINHLQHNIQAQQKTAQKSLTRRR